MIPNFRLGLLSAFLLLWFAAWQRSAGCEYPETRRDLPSSRSCHKRRRIQDRTTRRSGGLMLWKEPDISRVIPVPPGRQKYRYRFSTMSRRPALPPCSLQRLSMMGLSKYLNNPQVTVTVTIQTAAAFYLTGEVTRPGALPLLAEHDCSSGPSPVVAASRNSPD